MTIWRRKPTDGGVIADQRSPLDVAWLRLATQAANLPPFPFRGFCHKCGGNVCIAEYQSAEEPSYIPYHLDRGRYECIVWKCEQCGWITHTKTRGAKAALDALSEAEEGEWVEILNSGGDLAYEWRFSRDGSRVMYRDPCLINDWREDSEQSSTVARAYRAGRSVALEQVQELARMVLIFDGCRGVGDGGGVFSHKVMVDEQVLWALVEAAKKVSGC